jgi:hypothetical protein
VAGAASYRLRVWNLATRQEIACPAGLDCNPVLPTATHAGGLLGGTGYGYRAFAVDPCGQISTD